MTSRPHIAKIRAVLLLSAALVLCAAAPFQCASDPAYPAEDRPDEVLFHLAERFYEGGDSAAGAETLTYLIEHYPDSRFSSRARQRLGAEGAEQ